MLKDMESIYKHVTARLVDGNKVMRMKCCDGNSNEGMDMRIGNEDFFCLVCMTKE